MSAKTLDTNTVSRLADPREIRWTLEAYVDRIASFARHERKDILLTSNMIKTRTLMLAVPRATNAAQWGQLRTVVEYGRSRGVTVNVVLAH